MEPKHLAPITRTSSVNDVSEISDRIGLIPGPTFTVILPDGTNRLGFRDGEGSAWASTGNSTLPESLSAVPPPYLISYPIAPEATAQDAVVVRGAVLSTEQEREVYAEHFADPDGEEATGQQAMAVDGSGIQWRLLIDWENGQISVGMVVATPEGGGGAVSAFTSLPLPITIIEID